MLNKRRIGLREVRALPPDSEIWDSAVKGFGARRQRSEAIAYVLVYRTETGRQRRYTIGRHGSPWTPETARDEALRLLGNVASGGDPASQKAAKRDAATMADLCDAYLTDAEAGRILVRGGKPKKQSTVMMDRGRIDGHIRPLLGHLAVAAVTKADIETFMHAVAAGETVKRRKTKIRGLSLVRGGKGVATRSVGLLGGMFTYAIEKGMRTDNPAHKVRKYAEAQRDRRLTDDEYKALGQALAKAGENEVWPPAVAATRFLTLTGWRSGEAITLRWSDVDLARRIAKLPDTKTGASVRPLSNTACDLLAKIDRLSVLVFPPSKGKTTMTGFSKLWRRIAKLGPLPLDISPHVLRHSFASLAGDLGFSEPTIGALIGHKGQTITSRYMHSADAVLLAAADAVAKKTAELMGDGKAGQVISLRREA